MVNFENGTRDASRDEREEVVVISFNISDPIPKATIKQEWSSSTMYYGRTLPEKYGEVDTLGLCKLDCIPSRRKRYSKVRARCSMTFALNPDRDLESPHALEHKLSERSDWLYSHSIEKFKRID
jgi:hypothetical protein